MRPGRFLLVALLFAPSIACVSWKQSGEPASTVTTIPDPSRLTLRNRSVVYLRSGTLVGDSLIGKGEDKKGSRTAVALADVMRLDRQTVSRSKTFLAFGALLLGAGIVYEITRPPCRNCIHL